MGEFLNAVVGKIPNFVGIKYTCKNLEQGVKAMKANDGKFAVFLGNDQVLHWYMYFCLIWTINLLIFYR